ncbi:phosphodiester glycosidase family protein [Alteraurantiacibacter aestuarii]|uniref:phosphodiester glycosidase family protein n=1 Tax=Alteraurantiacibacter aestuarii TaxID=650004 RepID=UPI0031D5D7D8
MRFGARTAIHACLILALAACEAHEITPDEPVQDTQAPAIAAHPCEPVIFEDTQFTQCTADPAVHAIHMVHADADGEAYRSFASYAARRPADAPPVAFAMNGGMFDENGDPIGYYVEEGERLHGLNRAEGPGNFHMLPNGVFFGDATGNWHVWDTQRFFDNVETRPQFGTQSGPMLVVAGELHQGFDVDGDSQKIRNGVGVDPSGRAHFVISEVPVSFGRFARFFRDVLRTPNALFLDGSVSQLWDAESGRMDNRAPLGPLIIVEMRENGG